MLSDAGFGDQAAFVYTILLSQTCAFVATEDDRNNMDNIRKEAGVTYAGALDNTEPGMAALAKAIKPLTEKERTRRDFFDRQFHVFIDALLDGMDSFLAACNNSGKNRAPH